MEPEIIIIPISFDDRCKDFDRRRPTAAPVYEVPFADIEWEEGFMSSNDLLRHHLLHAGAEYISDYNGTLWFLFEGDWTHTRVRFDHKSNTAHFSRCVFLYPSFDRVR